MVSGFILAPIILKILRKEQIWKKDVKDTMYGEEATVFNEITKKLKGQQKIPRMGGFIIFFPILISLSVISFFFASKIFFWFSVFYGIVFLIAMFFDLIDVGYVKKFSPPKISHRLLLAFVLGTLLGIVLFSSISPVVGLPFGLSVYLGGAFIPLVGVWYLLWYSTSPIDGVDGLSPSIFFVIFLAMGFLGHIQFNGEVILLSAIFAGSLVPYLFYNLSPAKVYFTEVGIVTLLFGLTFLSVVGGVNGGDGFWFAVFAGAVLVLSQKLTLLQLYYRKRTGKKLFLSTPIHHHFQAKGLSNNKIVILYVGLTIIASLVGITLL